MNVLSVPIPDGYPVHLLPLGKGISINAGKICFDNSVTPKSREAYLKAATEVWHGKDQNFKLAKFKSFAPSDLEFSSFASKFNSEEVMRTYKFVKLSAANTKKDRDNDKLSKSYLEALAKWLTETQETVNLLWDHDTRNPIGKIISASVEPISGDMENFELMVTAGVNPVSWITSINCRAADAVDKEALNNISIRWKPMKSSEFVETESDWFRFFEYKQGDPLPQLLEVSFVSIPAQYDARMVKSFSENIQQIISNPKTKKMEQFTKSVDMKVDGKTYEVKFSGKGSDVSDTSFSIPKELTDKIVELESLKSENETLKKQVDEIKTPLATSIVGLQVKLEKSFKETEENLKKLSVNELTAKEKDLQAEFKAKNPSGQTNGEGKADANEQVKSLQW